MYKANISELYNILWWTTFGFFLSVDFKNDSINIKSFLLYTCVFLVVGSLIASIWGLHKFSVLITNSTYPESYYSEGGGLIDGSSLNRDYNVFSLGLCLSVFFSFHLRNSLKSKFFNFFHLLYLITVSSAVLLSSSRRGAVFIFITLLISIFLKFDTVNFYKSFSRFFKGVIPFFIVIILLFIVYFDTLFYLIIDSDFFLSSIMRVLTLKEELTSENERTIRWTYAFELIQKYNIKDFILGKGFDYLRLFGSKFDGIAEDHPHNFLIAALLYGGLLSLLANIILILFTISNFIKNSNSYLFFLVFIYLVLFGLTSNNTLFSFRIFPIVSIIGLMYNLPTNLGQKILPNVKPNISLNNI